MLQNEFISDLSDQAYNHGKSTSERILDGLSCEQGITDLSSFIDSCLEELINLTQPSAIDCRDGCHYCCHLRIAITPPEVFAILSYFLENSTQPQNAQFIEQNRASAEKAVKLDDEAYGQAQIACSFLDGNSCLAYEARPLECRGYNSQNKKMCADTYESYFNWNVPVYKPKYRLFKYAQAGLIAGLNDSRIDSSLLELNQALALALKDVNSESSWREGSNMFADAALPFNDSEVEAMKPWSPTF